MTDDQPIPSAPQNQDDAKNQAAAHPHSSAVPEVKIPPSHSCYAVTRHEKRDKWDIAKLLAEFIGLGFLIAYTLYTAGIYHANHTAAEAAKNAADTQDKTMRLSFRPRITLLGINPSVMQTMVNGKVQTSLDHGRLAVGISLPNTGPFAATNVRFFRFENLSPKNNAVKLPYEELFGEPKLIHPETDRMKASMTIFGGRTISATELRQLEDGTLWATFSILVVYDDDFGITHHTEYCDLFTLQPYNDICPWPVQND